jgi:hypothetical protein
MDYKKHTGLNFSLGKVPPMHDGEKIPEIKTGLSRERNRPGSHPILDRY